MKKIIISSLLFFGCSTSELELPITQPGSRYPRVVPTHNGGLLMSWFEKTDSVNWALKWSEFSDEQWTESQTITQGEKYFVNWADFPSIYNLGGDTISAHWLQKTGDGPYDYEVKVVISNDRGVKWSEPHTPHRDGVKGEHGFVSFFQDMSDNLGLVWLDGRNMSSGHNDHGYGAMNLYQTGFTSNGEMKWEMKMDDMVCECCPTSSVRTANAVILAYRDRSEGEIRDISIIRYAGGYWNSPYTLHKDDWTIAGCPVNGPMLANHENNVAIAWYTSPNSTPTVNVAFSKDEGASFDAPLRVDLSQPIGRVDLIWINENEVMASWIESAEKTTNIVTAIVSKEGEVQNPRVVSEIEPGRVSGYPQMEKVDDQLFFAWTEGGKNGGVETKWVALSSFR